MDPQTMLNNGDTPQSVAYWQTQRILWNGEPVWVQAPSKEYGRKPITPNPNTGD
jgi:hypothetical protein